VRVLAEPPAHPLAHEGKIDILAVGDDLTDDALEPVALVPVDCDLLPRRQPCEGLRRPRPEGLLTLRTVDPREPYPLLVVPRNKEDQRVPVVPGRL
jgi:hypothetical protein